jgi:hypothetical protein
MPDSRVALLRIVGERRNVDAAAVWLETGGMDAVYVGSVMGFELAGMLAPGEDRGDFLVLAAARIAKLNGMKGTWYWEVLPIPTQAKVSMGRPVACLPDALYYCANNRDWRVVLVEGHALAVRYGGRVVEVWSGYGWPVRKYSDRSIKVCIEDALGREIHGFTWAEV